jgi:hypothetical protein
MAFLDGLKRSIVSWLFPDEYIYQSAQRARLLRYEKLWNYARGVQDKQIKVKRNQQDDNIALNFVSLVIERSISMLFGKGITFDLPGDEETKQDLYLGEVWDLNRQEILLHKATQFATTIGTGYLKIMPGTYESAELPNIGAPRLVPINPMWMAIETEPEDMERVVRYTARYTIEDEDGEDVARKEVIERILGATDDEAIGADKPVAWKISNYMNSRETGNKWELMGPPVMWQWEFPPLLHWQNLPDADSVYGQSDIIDVIDLQDRVNFVASNISKIIRYHAHPKTWGRGGAMSRTSWGADEVIMFKGDAALLQNLEMASELGSSAQFLNTLRQSLMDITRTVDISSMADKLGALTNFGLRVLYQDALAKLATKRKLYGEALVELNSRILQLAGWQGDDADGGVVVWPEALPADELETGKALQLDLGMGLVSKQTAAGQRGYEWEKEQERLEEEAASGDNIGAALLRNFNRGQ